MPNIVICGMKPWAEAIAEQLRAELEIDCQVIDKEENISRQMQPALLITREMETVTACPVIRLEAGILRIGDIVSKVRRQLRKPAEPDHVQIGRGLNFSPWQKLLVQHDGGQQVDLTDKETQLLQSLYEANGHAVGRDALLKDIWGFESSLDTHTLETHIYRLRAKLRELTGDEMIVASDGGYRLESEHDAD